MHRALPLKKALLWKNKLGCREMGANHCLETLIDLWLINVIFIILNGGVVS